MLFAGTVGKVLTGFTEVWMVAAFIGSLALWIKNGADGTDIVYGLFLFAALLIVPVILILAFVCWLFGIEGYMFQCFK